MTAVGLDGFRSAQVAGQPSAYVRALTELLAGRKPSHWIWIVLPQLASLESVGPLLDRIHGHLGQPR